MELEWGACVWWEPWAGWGTFERLDARFPTPGGKNKTKGDGLATPALAQASVSVVRTNRESADVRTTTVSSRRASARVASGGDRVVARGSQREKRRRKKKIQHWAPSSPRHPTHPVVEATKVIDWALLTLRRALVIAAAVVQGHLVRG